MCWICLVVDRQPRCAGSILCWTDGGQRDAGRPWIRPWTAAPPVRQLPAWLCRQRRRRYLQTPHQDAPRGSAACARRNGEPARRCAGHTVARHRGREIEKGTSTPGQRWGGRTVPAGGGRARPPTQSPPAGCAGGVPPGPQRPDGRGRCGRFGVRAAAQPPARRTGSRKSGPPSRWASPPPPALREGHCIKGALPAAPWPAHPRSRRAVPPPRAPAACAPPPPIGGCRPNPSPPRPRVHAPTPSAELAHPPTSPFPPPPPHPVPHWLPQR